MMFGKTLDVKVIPEEKVPVKLWFGMGVLRKSPPNLRTTEKGTFKLEYRNRTRLGLKDALNKLKSLEQKKRERKALSSAVQSGGKTHVENKLQKLAQMGLSYELE
jgi:hypothetical protein